MHARAIGLPGASSRPDIGATFLPDCSGKARMVGIRERRREVLSLNCMMTKMADEVRRSDFKVIVSSLQNWRI